MHQSKGRIKYTLTSTRREVVLHCAFLLRTIFASLARANERALVQNVKPRPNDRNMPTQHIATLLSATCCVRLATVLRCVATCWVLLAQIWPASNLSQQHATCRNRVAKRAQHVAPNNVGICCAECWIVWPGLNTKELTQGNFLVLHCASLLRGRKITIEFFFLYLSVHWGDLIEQIKKKSLIYT